ncbi:hypothetical protein [Acetobacter syzygii]|uniref:hypothetical protein n=1 Tax=Acetobacter syzygii TaxID=146476 RepID=UPI0015713422|nr:hypothetical protein [Acetobacter syzygii]NSL91718.1 hypothetical protein [Acetobacter syzygii]
MKKTSSDLVFLFSGTHFCLTGRSLSSSPTRRARQFVTPSTAMDVAPDNGCANNTLLSAD